MREKICILTTVHPLFDSRIFHREAKTLVRAEYKVSLIAQHDKEEIVDGVKIVPLSKPNNRFERMTKVVWKLFRLALKEEADIYHFHDPEIIPVGLLLKLLTRAKIIYDIHEDIPAQILTKEWIPSYMRTFVGGLFNHMQKICSLFFDAIIVAGNDIAKHFPFCEKINVVRNFPSLEIVKNLNLSKEKEKREQIILIYIGVIAKDRGIQQMVEAIHLIKSNIKLMLVGSFCDSVFCEYIKEIAGGKVEFVGQVPHERVFKYLSVADIGLILFHDTPNNITAIKGRNRKIFEYMTMGLPIVASNLEGWREAIEDEGYGVVVNPLDPRDIANGIKKLIDNPQLRIEMGQKGINSCLNEFNWEKEKQAFLEVYENLFTREGYER